MKCGMCTKQEMDSLTSWSSWFEPNVEICWMNQKMEMLKKSKASHCKKENVLYPQGHLVTMN